MQIFKNCLEFPQKCKINSPHFLSLVSDHKKEENQFISFDNNKFCYTGNVLTLKLKPFYNGQTLKCFLKFSKMLNFGTVIIKVTLVTNQIFFLEKKFYFPIKINGYNDFIKNEFNFLFLRFSLKNFHRISV